MRECTCNLGADYCEDGCGVFGPLGNGGSCAVRQCEKESQTDRYWREMRERQVGENAPDWDVRNQSWY